MRELHEQRSAFLRGRVAAIAARLETLPPGDPVDQLGESEPGLADLHVLERGDDPDLEPLWEGNELFRTTSLDEGEEKLIRAWVPFHAAGAMRIARIDLSARIVDTLVEPARTNLIVSIVSSVTMAVLAVYAAWSRGRNVALERRRMEMEHLADLGKLSAVLAHEIRNPLGTIKGFTQLAREKADANVSALLKPALDETARLENLVRDLLLYGRPPRPFLRRVPWREVQEAVSAHARQLILGHPIQYETKAGISDLDTDPAILTQALLNLIRNSIEAIGEGCGRVELRAKSEQERTVIEVTDDGPGFSREAQARLYEPFFTTKPAGTGLGLATARNLVRSLGGELDLRPDERGVTAIIRLPRPVPGAFNGIHSRS
jgi:signal transduction histidine kinase